MKPLSIVLSINISLLIIIAIFTGFVLGFPYIMPLVLGLVALLNFALAGVFWHSQEKEMLKAFLLGGLLIALAAGSVYGYMYFFTPEKLDFMKDLSNGN